MIKYISRADRIDSYHNLKASRKQIKSRLQHANVGFHTANKNMLNACLLPIGKQMTTFTTTKTKFAGDWMGGKCLNPLCKIGGERTKFIRGLFHRYASDSQNVSPVEEPADIPNRSFRCGLNIEQTLLDINNQKPGILGSHQFGATRQ